MALESLEFKEADKDVGPFRRRLVFAFGLVVLCLTILLGRLAWLQIIRQDAYQQRAEQNRTVTTTTQGSRGLIFDRNGTLIAGNRLAWSLEITIDQTAEPVDRLIDRYFTCFENDDPDAMLDLFLPEVIAYMQDDDTVTGREEALIQLDDWYYDYGKAIDDYYVYDEDSLDASDVRELQRELGVRIDDNVIVACDVEYRNGQDNDFYFEFVQVDGQWYLLFVVE